MLIDPRRIADRFEENLEWTERLDLVSAWVTEHDGLRLLEKRAKRGLKVRAIVGLWNYITEPKALRQLDRLGKLRLADSARFHPKVYLFRGQSRTCAWIGSANFTAGGFTVNEEAVFETGDTESVISWFKNLWQDCGRLDENAIDSYERARKKNPIPRQSLVPVAGGGMTEPMKLLERVTDWDSYVTALRDCDVWWSNNQPWSVLGESLSWHHTIEVLHDTLTREGRLADLDYDDQCRILGVLKDCGEGLLSTISPVCMPAGFVHNAEGIQRILREVSEADDSAFPDLAFDAYGRMIEFKGVGKAIATRLLSLARPDRFVSVNDSSQEDLARYAGLDPSHFWPKANYQKLLEFIYEKQWFQISEPDGRLERSIWGMRAALLDCFVYQP